MTAGRAPKIVQDDWKLQIFGLVEEKCDFGWQEIMSMGAETIIADFHCVTQWTRLNNVWRAFENGGPKKIWLEECQMGKCT